MQELKDRRRVRQRNPRRTAPMRVHHRRRARTKLSQQPLNRASRILAALQGGIESPRYPGCLGIENHGVARRLELAKGLAKVCIGDLSAGEASATRHGVILLSANVGHE